MAPIKVPVPTFLIVSVRSFMAPGEMIPKSKEYWLINIFG